jgi:3-oxoacyl-[acyl-carrier protein] reductase
LNHIVNNGAFTWFLRPYRSWLLTWLTKAGFTYDRMLHTMPDDAWDIILKIHVTAPFRLIRAAAPFMRIKAGAGTPVENRSIINVSSTSGLHGNIGQANYAAAKSAVTGFTKTIAKEWGTFGVRANTVAFGYILTRYADIYFVPLSAFVGYQLS